MNRVLRAAVGIAALAVMTQAAQSQSTVIRGKTHVDDARLAMLAAGRTHPSDAEVEHAAAAMDHGVTRAQIQTIAKCNDGDRSLVVAFDVLGALAARGIRGNQAVARVQAQITSGASDAALASLVTGDGVSVVNTAHARPE